MTESEAGAPGEGAPSTDARIDARRLLKDFRGRQPDLARAAATRLTRLRSFADRSADELLADPGRVRLKHAFTVVAVERGYPSWLAYSRSVAAHANPDLAEAGPADPEPAAPEPADPELYVPALGAFLNRWFADYDEARRSLENEGGYLFPHRRQFFVCEAEAVRVMGFDPDDPDWAAIGFDWVGARDPSAQARLRASRATR